MKNNYFLSKGIITLFFLCGILSYTAQAQFNPPTADCPGDVHLPQCTPVGVIQDAFMTWIEGFSYTLDIDRIATEVFTPPKPETLPTNAEFGYELMVIYTVIDDLGHSSSCVSSFTVAPYNCGGHIFPTKTTCNQYLTGSATGLQNVCYTPSAPMDGSVKKTQSREFIYFSTFIASLSTFTVDIIQTSDNKLSKLFALQMVRDIKLYDAGSNIFPNTIASEPTIGQAHLEVTGAIPGRAYAVAVKYNVKSLMKSTFTGPAPECVYNFVTRIKGYEEPNTAASLTATPNCTDNSSMIDEDLFEKKAILYSKEPDAGLLQVYPNPFNEAVSFEFVSQKDAHAVLDIYNLMGQKITTLMDRTVSEGVLNKVEFQPYNQVSGVFLYQLLLDDKIMKGKIVYNK